MIRVRTMAMLIFCWAALVSSLTLGQHIEISESPSTNTFPLVGETAVDIVIDAGDAEVVDVAAHLLAEDIQCVTGQHARVLTALDHRAPYVLIVGTIGKNRLVDGLIKSGKLEVSQIQGQWESYVITTVDNPFEGIERALVIAGSDRRGTAYGVFTLSEAMGVSPWYDWADVPTAKKKQIHLSTRTLVQGPPSVKYRGIFINDEDWGLQPWAAQHLDTDIEDLGPKTYAKVFELLLRLKANYIWPGMHPCTQAFNIYPENKIVADRYAIVMGASHCEPMLRNNVTEWDKQTMGDWDYETNRDTIYHYWDTRVKENGTFENLYTVGMRGIHDSGIPGGGSNHDKRERLERIIADQREMLANHVNPDPAQVPQIFCPYKEVLNIYKLGMQLPDDITMVWPDDNFGYIRNLSTPEERRRSGGSGVYYHMSYWGSPQDFLWISSTSPALIAYEMSKAYAYGANRVWVFNVGDIKPIEMEMEFALRLAYDVDRYSVDKAMGFIEQWAGRTFGDKQAQGIADIQKEYYRLTQQVKPEHIDRVHFSPREQEQRLADYQVIVEKANAIYQTLASEYHAAFFQLVLYPVKSAALMNQKQTYAVQGDYEKALKAYNGIQELARIYNKELVNGKWDGMMDPAPRNTRVFRKPDPNRIRQQSQPAVRLVSLDPADAQCTGLMKLVDGAIVGTASDMLPEGSGSQASFTFQSEQAQRAVLYFLAQCPDDKHDSWFVSFNGHKTVSNNQPTGYSSQWLKVMDVNLQAGTNALIISHREPGAMIEQIAFMNPGKAPENPILEPTAIFAADQYRNTTNTALSRWHRIEGLGIENFAMTVLPYETPSIDVDDALTAPAISYSFKAATSQCTVEARFLPTHRINEGMGLRYAIRVDEGPVQIQDINAPEWSGVWSQNVLQGYSLGRTSHDLNDANPHTLTLYFLDPGMVLSQVRILTE